MPPPPSRTHAPQARPAAAQASLKQFRDDQRGGVVVLLGVALPMLFSAVGAATDYASLIARRTQLQNAADSAALRAANELTLSNADDRVAEIAKAAAVAILATNTKSSAGTAIESEVLRQRSSVKVSIKETMPVMMGHFLGYPTIDIGVKAVATLSGKRRICVIGLDPDDDGTIRLDQNAKLTAEKCEVQSNSKHASGVKAFNNTVLKAERTCTAGGYKANKSSNFAPAPVTDCPSVGDPLAERAPPFVGGCDYNRKVVKDQRETLNPGVYCGGLKVTRGGAANLNPGIYVVKDGRLEVDMESSLTGEDVSFYFIGPRSVLDFDPDTTISLSAQTSGPLAGILFFEDRNAPLNRIFRITSNNARKLIGTIYLPQGKFYVAARNPVADQSAYTVVVARKVHLEAGPDLVLNTNYGATAVPVPAGVGAVSGKAGLSE